MTRRSPSLTEKLGSALLEIQRLRGHPIDRDKAKGMSAGDICRLFETDHDPIPVANGGTNHPTNLKPRLKAEHLDKTRRDIKTIAKGKRLARKHAEFRALMLAKVGVDADCAPTRRSRHPLPCGKNSRWKKPLGKLNAVRRVK